MKNISNVNDLLSLDSNITAKKKSPALNILLGIIGIAILGYAISIKDNFNLSSAFLAVGAALFIASLIGFAKKRMNLYYSPTGEKFVCKQRYFDLCKKSEVLDNLNNRDFVKLSAASASNDSALMVIIYSTPNDNHGVAQILEYRDYQYTPLDEPVVK